MNKHSVVSVVVGLGLLLSLGSTTLPAMADEHDHHHMEGAELQLNDGQKWETDAPLRLAIGKVGHELNARLNDIHHNKLDAAGYAVLALHVNEQVAYMVQNCELEPAADEQLHIVIGRMLLSAQGMQQHNELKEKRQAAVQLVGALDNYATYFVDTEFVKPKH